MWSGLRHEDLSTDQPALQNPPLGGSKPMTRCYQWDAVSVAGQVSLPKSSRQTLHSKEVFDSHVKACALMPWQLLKSK